VLIVVRHMSSHVEILMVLLCLEFPLHYISPIGHYYLWGLSICVVKVVVLDPARPLLVNVLLPRFFSLL
jgi:hypothetical protein